MSVSTPNQTSQKALIALIKRLHMMVGLFIGPFILIAAITGTLYVLSPQIEAKLYQEQLTTPSRGEFKSLELQIQAARDSLESPLVLKAVRPSVGEGNTTRVLFSDPNLDRYRLRTIFVDPVNLEVRGDLATYGTSGALSFRIALDFMHSDLLIGALGRNYSELAASWMWLSALGGTLLWWRNRGKNKRLKNPKGKSQYLSYRSRHNILGMSILAGLLFFSATGLTWSKWAGSNIAEWRQALNWVTPLVSLNLGSPSVVSSSDQHAEHHMKMVGSQMTIPDSMYDHVQYVSRSAGIDASKIEIRPPGSPDKAWLVKEIDRSWPTQVDSVAIDPTSMSIVSRADFVDFPIVAKLIRWGIDAHMGVLFGLPNQLLLAAFGIALVSMIVFGYAMWWKKRGKERKASETLIHHFLALSFSSKLATLLLSVILGTQLPLLGISLIVFVGYDWIVWAKNKSRDVVTSY